MEHIQQKNRRIVVVGAGAAGLAAAVFAARAQASVTVLEGMDRPGKKLLLTGSGRCNLTNTDPDLPGRYHGSGAALAGKVTKQFGAAQTCAFFEELGLLTQEKNGYVYPYTAQSASVLEVLLLELRRLGVKLKLREKITEVRPAEEGFLVCTESWQYPADAVILACGSCAAPLTGSDGSGYTLAKRLGHRMIPAGPALVPLTCRAGFLNALAGVRCRAEISLYKGKPVKKRENQGLPEQPALLGRERGELQWTRYGVSGIAVFQLSRFVSRAEGPFYLEADLLPDFTKEELAELLLARAETLGGEKLSALLAGFLQEKLIPVVLGEAGGEYRKQSCRDLTGEQAVHLIDTIKHLQLLVSGTKDFDAAQAASGGVDASELTSMMESRIIPGIYFAGELVDVDGPCGGYNLQWAWSSGRLAGLSAAGCGTDCCENGEDLCIYESMS